MEKDQLSRKLAVILHADVVGSTSLVQKDETLAHKRIREVFNNFSETIGAYGGITHEIRGDALVAKFERASDAVSAAMAFQDSNANFIDSFDDGIKPELRVGISLGEVVIADNTITGEGVVLAQRLEQLAEPGGIVVQGSVSETVPSRMPFEFESLGTQDLKGFDQPVRAFSVSLDKDAEIPPAEERLKLEVGQSGNTVNPPNLSPESFKALTGERFELPVRPSIAVLPFVNMSGDPEQEFFADGISEDIITALSRIPDLVVISRSSTFVYKGQVVDVRQVGQDLGVGHVLEGSVRKAGDRVRINVQLVETRGGEHVWAEHYDRNLDDIFTIQDEITQSTAVELSVKLVGGEFARKVAIGTKSTRAWELVRRASALLDTHARLGTDSAKLLIDDALKLDDHYAAAWATLGWIYWLESTRNWVADPETTMHKAFETAQKALSFDPNYPMAYSLLGHIHMSRGEAKEAIAMGEKSLELAPGDSYSMGVHADLLIESGRIDEGLGLLKKAIRLCPFPPAWILFLMGMGLHLKGDNPAAIFALEQAILREPGSHLNHVWLTSALVDEGKLDDARSVASKVLEIDPAFSIGSWSQGFHSTTHLHIRDNLLAVGLPE